ncbi:uncharacterized protein F5891DRAFT_986832, partial [Suillus fuscotomentosus]
TSPACPIIAPTSVVPNYWNTWNMESVEREGLPPKDATLFPSFFLPTSELLAANGDVKNADDHRLQFHSLYCRFRFVEHPEVPVVVARRADGTFQCPACLQTYTTYKKMHNHGSRTKGPIHKVSVAKWVNARMQPVKRESDLEDQDEEIEDEDADDMMDEEDIIEESLLAPAEEGYDVAPSSPLANPYTQLTLPESSPPVIPAAQHRPSCSAMQSSTQGPADWDMQLSHRQPSTAAFSQRVARSSTEDDSIEVTAPPPSQFTKVDPKTKPASARPETVLSQADIQVFGPQPADGRGIFAIPFIRPSSRRRS